MPAPVVAAGIAAGGTLVGNILQSRSQGKAIDAQERAQREALQYQREVEEQRRREYEEQQAMLRAQWEAREARLAPFRAAQAAVLRGWGFNVPDYTPQALPPTGWTPEAAASSAAMGRPVTLGQLGEVMTGERVMPVEPAPAIPRPATLGSLFAPQVGRPQMEMVQ